MSRETLSCTLLVACFWAHPAFALNLNEYLAQVQSGNRGQIGAEKQAHSAQLKWHEGNFLFVPSFFTEARFASDGQPANPPFLTYNRIDSQYYAAGLSQQFSFGLQGKLYYLLSHTNYVNAPLLTGNTGDFWDTRPVLELSMPLWNNGFGRAVRAQQQSIQDANRIEEYNAKSLFLSSLVDAENAYWGLVVSREILRTQKVALDYANSILDYVRKKARMRLGDDSDILQAEALVAARKLELNRAETEEQVARKGFNAMRGVVSDEVTELLDLIPYKALEAVAIPQERPGERYDVQAAHSQTSLASANSKIAVERTKPTLELYSTYAMNGRGDSTSNAISNLSGADRSTKVIGIRFNVPLDLSAANKVRSGALIAEEAQRDQYEQKRVLQDRDWNALVQRLKDSKGALLLADELVRAQTKKLSSEQKRLKNGRTTTYQVLLFEQDRSQAELSRAQLAQQALDLRSRLKLYQTQNTDSPDKGKDL